MAITVKEIEGLKNREDPAFTITQFFEKIKAWIEDYKTAENKINTDIKGNLVLSLKEEESKKGTFDFSLSWGGVSFQSGSVRIADEDIQAALNTLKNDFEELGRELSTTAQSVINATGHALSINEEELSLDNGASPAVSLSKVELPGAIWKTATLTETATVTSNGTSYVYSLVDDKIAYGKTVLLMGSDDTAKRFIADHYTRGTLAASGGVLSFQLDSQIGTNKVLYSIQEEK